VPHFSVERQEEVCELVKSTGDFLIYSDPKFIKLDKPIKVELPECPL
jgi:hypothetical protein